MKLGCVSDCMADLTRDAMLDRAAALGLNGVEVTTGGWSRAPHVDLAELKANPKARRRFRRAFESRGLEIVSLNASGNPLHPTDRAQGDCLLDTIRLAGEMGIGTVCTMSGLPAGTATDTTPNWVVSSWPPETQTILSFQWDEVLLPFWEAAVAVARDSGVRQIALGLHGNQCVYNVPSLLKLRELVGPMLGASLDPGQLAWMGADPLVAAEALGEAIHHVHAGDVMLNPPVLATTSRLETGVLADAASRAWSPVTPGYGHGADWWRQFCYRLRMAGYDGWLSIQQQDQLIDPGEGLETAVTLLRSVMPAVPCEWLPDDG